MSWTCTQSGTFQQYTSLLTARLSVVQFSYFSSMLPLSITRFGPLDQAALLAAQGPAPSGSPTDKAYLAAIAGALCRLLLTCSDSLFCAHPVPDPLDVDWPVQPILCPKVHWKSTQCGYHRKAHDSMKQLRSGMLLSVYVRSNQTRTCTGHQCC